MDIETVRVTEKFPGLRMAMEKDEIRAVEEVTNQDVTDLAQTVTNQMIGQCASESCGLSTRSTAGSRTDWVDSGMPAGAPSQVDIEVPLLNIDFFCRRGSKCPSPEKAEAASNLLGSVIERSLDTHEKARETASEIRDRAKQKARQLVKTAERRAETSIVRAYAPIRKELGK